ncbi:TPA: hypothetical protein ACGVAQ_004444 [Vibrio vulnificus]
MDFFIWLCGLNWAAIIQNIVGMATLGVAYLALSSWKKQMKMQKTIELFDELTNSIHEFVLNIGPPLQHLDFMHISIESYQYDPDLNRELTHPQEVMFIQKEGRHTYDLMAPELIKCSASVNKIRSLLVKAQVLNIERFNECDEACRYIIWQYDRLQAVLMMISNSHLNWEDPSVVRRINDIKEITSADINKYLAENQKIYLEFIKSVYDRVYGKA